MRRIILVRLYALIALWLNATSSARAESITQQAAESLFSEVRSILAQCSTNKSAWSTNKARILRIYNQFGFDVTIDDEHEFQALGFGLEMALQPKWRADVTLESGWPTNRQEWLAEYVKRNDFSPLPFTRQAWSQDEARDRTRYRMFKEFKRTNQVIGMRVEQLIAELGKPSPGMETATWLSYGVGPEIGVFVIDYQSLDFEVSDGKVVSYRFVPH